MDGAAAHVVTFGTVAAIEGARARVVLDMAEDGSGFAGPVPPQIGQVVRVDVGEARVFGVIIGLRTPAAEQAIIGPPNQIMDLDLIGEVLVLLGRELLPGHSSHSPPLSGGSGAARLVPALGGRGWPVGRFW